MCYGEGRRQYKFKEEKVLAATAAEDQPKRIKGRNLTVHGFVWGVRTACHVSGLLTHG